MQDLRNVGSYTGAASPNGTFDQGENVAEWTDNIQSAGSGRGLKGVGYLANPTDFMADDTVPSASVR